jgi:hypothetical protein
VDAKRLKIAKADTPIISQSRVQLHDGKHPIETEINILNPREFPEYLVTLMIEYDPEVPSSSAKIELDEPSRDAFRRETTISGVKMNAWRYNEYSQGPSKFRNTFFVIDKVPAKSVRTLVISGTVATNSWANLSIIEFRRKMEVPNFGPNTAIFPQFDSDSVILKRWNKPESPSFLTSCEIETKSNICIVTLGMDVHSYDRKSN